VKERAFREDFRVIWEVCLSFFSYYYWYIFLDFRHSPWNEYCFLVLGLLHGVRRKYPDDVSGPTAALETSSGNLTRTPCINPKTKKKKSIF
jgi:hypothetical protein